MKDSAFKMTSTLHVGRYKIDPGEEVHLDKVDPNDTSGFDGKDEDELGESKKLNEKLRQLQEMLYAEHKTKVLVILQAVDTGGKDGVIHRVFEGVNPQGVQVCALRSTNAGGARPRFPLAPPQESAWERRACDLQPEPL
jgi:polyphosphate kinase 2 (PPK2 family)